VSKPIDSYFQSFNAEESYSSDLTPKKELNQIENNINYNSQYNNIYSQETKKDLNEETKIELKEKSKSLILEETKQYINEEIFTKMKDENGEENGTVILQNRSLNKLIKTGRI
jgi:hypothetical protein